jgi:hypothetical protein
MTQARTKRRAAVEGAKGPAADKTKAKPWSILDVPMEESQIEVIVAAAKSEGESVEEYIYGAASMRLSQDLRLMERFLAGFALSAADVARLNQMHDVRKAAAEARRVLTGLQTHFLDTKLKLHRKHEQEQLDQVFRPELSRP